MHLVRAIKDASDCRGVALVTDDENGSSFIERKQRQDEIREINVFQTFLKQSAEKRKSFQRKLNRSSNFSMFLREFLH